MTQWIPRRSVFLVDDHPVVLSGIRAMVEAQPDLQVAGVAGDVENALIGVAETLPDIVVVDVSLPGASGTVLVDRMRTLFPQVATLALTLHEEAAYVRQLLEAGAIRTSSLLRRPAVTRVFRRDLYQRARNCMLRRQGPPPASAEHPTDPACGPL